MSNPFRNPNSISNKLRKQGAKDLILLADHLETNVKDKRFNLDYWGRVEGPADKTLTVKNINVCGTTACALGHAATMPKFTKRGLRMEDDFGNQWSLDHTLFRVVYKTEYMNGMDAAAEFFGLTPTESLFLFDPTEYPDGHKDRMYVAKRIRTAAKIMQKQVDKSV